MRNDTVSGPESLPMDPEGLPVDLAEVVKDRRKMKALIHGLFDQDMRRRFSAAKALGELSRLRPEFIRKIGRASSMPLTTP